MIGNTISMDAEAWNEFVSLPKEKQIEKVYNSLSPKNMEQAEELLKKVPNGSNISDGSPKTTKSNNATNDKIGSDEVSSKGRGTSSEKS